MRKKKRIRSGQMSPLFWLGIAFFGVAGIILYNHYTFCAKAQELIATVSVVKSPYGWNRRDDRFYVNYEYRGKQYKDIPLNITSNEYDGQEIIIYCDKEDPTHICGKRGAIGWAIMSTFAGCILCLAAISERLSDPYI